MTTNHKPTFDSRRGRDLQPTNISHGRQVAGHTKLKYREGHLNEQEAKQKFKDLREELRAKERALIEGKEKEQNNEQKLIQEEAQEGEEEEEEEEDQDQNDEGESEVSKDTIGATTIITVNPNTKQTNEDQDEDESSDFDSEGSDSEDEAELLKELAKIKAERAAAANGTGGTAQSQYIPDQTSTTTETTEPPKKKSWRDKAIFKTHRQDQGGDSEERKRKREQDEFVNDLSRSGSHKRFMDRFIR